MRRSCLGFLGILLGCLFFPQLISAQSNPLELVAGLREQGYLDLAEEYLLKLQKNPNTDFAYKLPLELADVKLEQANEESEESRKTKLLLEAEGYLNNFLKANSKSPLASSATVSLARLMCIRGRASLSRSRRGDDEKEQNAQRTVARKLLSDAAALYQTAAIGIRTQLRSLPKDDKNKSTIVQLNTALIRAEIDRGIALYDIAQTFDPEGSERKARGDKLEEAKKSFENSAYREPILAISFVARAWEAQADHEMDRRDLSEPEFEALLKDRNPLSESGVRLARLFRMRHIVESDDPKIKNKFAAARGEAEKWLADYPKQRKSADGIAVRYFQARTYQLEADLMGGVKRDPSTRRAVSLTPNAEKFIRTAEGIYRDIAETDNDYADRADRNRMICILTRTDASKQGDVKPSDVKNFEEAYLQALIGQARLSEKIKKIQKDAERGSDRVNPAKEIRETEKAGYQNIMAFLEQAISLATPKDPISEVLNARVLMAYGYYKLDQFAQAAVLAESLAKANPKSRHALPLSAMAVNSFIQTRVELKEAKKIPEPAIRQATFIDARRAQSLANYVESGWPADNNTDAIRYNIGFLLRSDRRYEDALKVYNRVQPSYTGFARSTFEQGLALFGLMRAPEGTDASSVVDYIRGQIQKYPALWSDTVRKLNSVAPPALDSSKEEVLPYYLCKIQLGTLLQMEGKDFKQIETLGKTLLTDLPKFNNFTGTEAADSKYSAMTIMLNGIQGQAIELVRVGKLAETMAILDPLIQSTVKQSLSEKAPTKPSGAFEQMRNAQRGILVLALRTTVQEGKIDQAKGYLTLLQSSGSSAEATTAVLSQLVSSVRTQLDRMDLQIRTAKEEDKKAVEEERKKISESFSLFLDTLAGQPDVNDQMRIFLARGYSEIGNHKSASQLLETLFKAQPTITNDVKDPKNLFAIQVNLLYARTARLAGDFPKAEAVLKVLIGDAKNRGVGFGTVPIRKEKCYLLEDQKKFKDAVNEWVAMTKQFVGNEPPPIGSEDKKIRDRRAMYLDLFYEAQRCSARAYDSLNPAMYEQQKNDGNTRVASKLVEFETKNEDLPPDLKDRIRTTLENYPGLKAKYLELGGKLIEGSKKTAAGK
jgi:hypothetical protein